MEREGVVMPIGEEFVGRCRLFPIIRKAWALEGVLNEIIHRGRKLWVLMAPPRH
jgi:hypothetical protein